MSRTSTGSGWLLLLRWSGRDLRARWLQVAAIALVIALGTGSYAGLSSVTRWRRDSTEDGYGRLSMYDLRVRLAEGSTVPEGTLRRAVSSLPGIGRVEERLIIDVQVDASVAERAILVPGVLYGVPVGEGDPAVNGFSIATGRSLTVADRGQPNVLLERNFAKQHNLPSEGTVQISGGRELTYVGQALTPEYFAVTTERGGIFLSANFAAVFTSLETAQVLAGREGAVNDLVLTLQAGRGDRYAAADELKALLKAELPGVGTTVMTREEDPSVRLLKADMKGDQRFYDIFASLIFAGAVVAAFNLVARIVESQRREIGLSMAVGVPPLRIAVRPLLVAAEIALMGVLFGIAVGVITGRAMASVLSEFQAVPEWRTPFLPAVFLGVGLAGFLLPFLATTWPVWRAVHVPPVKAIQAGYRSVRGGGVAPLLSRVRLPGNTFWKMPMRNVVRTPRRSLLTIFGVAAALAALVAFVGLIDSFVGTIDRGQREVTSRSPGRAEVALDRPYRVASPEVSALAANAAVGRAEPGLRLESVVSSGTHEVPIQLELLSLDSPIWTPSIVDGTKDRQRPGIYLSRLAARDLGVGVGDTVTLRHPRLAEEGRFEIAETQLPVLGLHPHPFRFVAYMDTTQAGLFNLAGTANLIQVVPAGDTGLDELKRSLFPLSGVTSVQGVDELAQAFADLLDEFVVVLRVVEGVMLLLTLLIAFNSASINMDERAREHATMFAFGVPIRAVLRMAVVENLILGVFATALGLAGGWLLLRLIIVLIVPVTLPDIDVPPAISGSTLLVTFALGVLAVALAPILTWRRLTRMNVPATLKVFD